VDRGSPTATWFGTGAAFPAKYQQALLLGDWSYGKIYALHLTPKGASYSGEYETLISGQPLNITDMIVGTDGAVYFTTGGNGTDTGLFRIVYKGNSNTNPVKISADAGMEFRELRKKLEAWHFSYDPQGLNLALDHIGHEDRFIRNAARVILERHAPGKWINALDQSEHIHKKTALLTALIRTDSLQQFEEQIYQYLKSFDLDKLSEQERLAVIRLYELSFTRNDQAANPHIAQAYDHLLSVYSSNSALVNKEASHVLGFLAGKKAGNQQFIASTLNLLENTDDPTQFIHYLGTLRKVRHSWKPAQRLAYQHWIDYAQDHITGGSLFSHYLGVYEKDFQRTLSPVEQGLLATSQPGPLDPDKQGPVPPRPRPSTNTMDPSLAIYDWRIDDLNTSLELVTSPRLYVERDFNRGRQMFRKGRCISCHYMHDQGGNIGPDLTTAGNSFGVEQLLTAIIEPSRDISTRFQSTKFTLKDDEVLHGRIVSENETNYVIQTGADASQTREVFKTDLASKESSQISSMPQGLLNTMNKEEVLDLLYYIVEVARKSKSGITAEIHEDQTLFEKGDSTLIEIIDYSGLGDIYYTLDGSEPDDQAIKYTQPFFVNQSSLIKAVSIYEEIMSDVQVRSVHAVDKEQNGLNWKLYRNRDPELPDVSGLKPDATGVAYTINVNNIAEAENKYLLHFEGYLQVKNPGAYTFYTLQDDFIRLYIDDQLVVESMQKWFDGEKQGNMQLSAGRNKIRVEYYDHLSTEYVAVFWEGPGIPKQEIPGHVLFKN